MNFKMLTLGESDYPERLTRLASPPKRLYYWGSSPSEILSSSSVAIVGARNISAYGKEVTTRLASDLAQREIAVISGLALGVDATAQKSALESGGKVIAVLPSPLDNILPKTNYRLALEIVESGGCLITEYSAGSPAYKQNFISRNRIVAALADVLIITEAAEKSGSLHTANFAIDMGKDVMAVPGRIYDSGYIGSNNLIKRGAFPLTRYRDVLNLLGIKDSGSEFVPKGRNANEQTILDLLASGVRSGQALLETSGLTPVDFAKSMTMLELGGKIQPLGANNWSTV